jgi:rSAM/selenodomain-associated transferase 1
MPEAEASPGGVLVLFAKEPTPGKVKTRMTPPFSPQQAAELYDGLLMDTLAASQSMAQEHALHFVLAIDPPESLEAFRARCSKNTDIRVQKGDQLGKRLARMARDLAHEGFSPILIRGSDSPDLKSTDLREGLTALGESDLVFCPDRDGGYNLIGMNSSCDPLFDLPMSTESVLEETLHAARREGLSAHTLSAGFDWDCVQDLRDARAFIASESFRQRCPNTHAYLTRPEVQALLE